MSVVNDRKNKAALSNDDNCNDTSSNCDNKKESEELCTKLLDDACDSHGLQEHTNDDWTDVKHSMRKNRDRILPDKVVLDLMKKSDLRGFMQLGAHVMIAGCSGRLVHSLLWTIAPNAEIIPDLVIPGLLLLIPSMVLHGFVLQCLSYCAQHETMHRTAFKTKSINVWVSFLVSLPCFEFSTHEKCMHKSHHTWTNCPRRDPELLCLFPKSSKKKGFRKVPDTHEEYLREMFFVWEPIKSHFGRIINCARGIPVDYTGTGWCLSKQDADAIKSELQWWARLQVLTYSVVVPILVYRYGIINVVGVWIVPAILGFCPINYVRNGEHSGECQVGGDLNGLKNTRSTMSNAFTRLLMWNMNLHCEHHLYPAVPFFNLPELRRHLEAHIANKSPDFWSVNQDMYWEWIPKQARGELREDEQATRELEKKTE